MAPSESDKRDPIAQAMANWERAGRGKEAQGIVTVTPVIPAHQILLTILLWAAILVSRRGAAGR